MSHSRTLAVTACPILTLALQVFVAHPAVAGTQDNARLAFHVKSHTTKSSTICTTWKPAIPCSEYGTYWPVGVNCDIYLAVVGAYEGPGISGLSCGVYYDAADLQGVDLFGYALCADSESPSAGENGPWPSSGSGNRITWNPVNNCQRTAIAPYGVHAVACSFYVYAYSADTFYIARNMNVQTGPELTVTDCAGSVTSLWHCARPAGSVGFDQPGCNPCTHSGACWHCTGTQSETWGRLKAMY